MLGAVKTANVDLLRGYALRFDAPLDHADPDDGQTLLIKAAIHDRGLEQRVAMCRVLLEKGANPDAKVGNLQRGLHCQGPGIFCVLERSGSIPRLTTLIRRKTRMDKRR